MDTHLLNGSGTPMKPCTHTIFIKYEYNQLSGKQESLHGAIAGVVGGGSVEQVSLFRVAPWEWEGRDHARPCEECGVEEAVRVGGGGRAVSRRREGAAFGVGEDV